MIEENQKKSVQLETKFAKPLPLSEQSESQQLVEENEDSDFSTFMNQGVQKRLKETHSLFLHRPLDYRSVYKQQDQNPQVSATIGPLPPKNHDPTKIHYSSDSDEDSEDSQEELFKDVDYRELGIPLTHCVKLTSHTKSIMSVEFDHSGSRMVSTGGDFSIKLWDFANMTNSFEPFRTLDPIPGDPPRNVVFNKSSTLMLRSGGNSKPKIMTRDGRIELEFIKGDMYIRDAKYTKGHIGIVTSGEWHPFHENICLTSSLDSTIRIWDITGQKVGISQLLPSQQTIKCKNQKGTKTGVWQARFSPSATQILAACQDGSYQLFDQKNKFCRPENSCHLGNPVQITDLRFFKDGFRFISRGQDNTVRLFDTRKFDRPFYSFYGLENNHEQTQVSVSPDEKYLITGTSGTKTSPGSLVLIDVESCNEVTRIPLTTAKVTTVRWVEQLNQIFVGAGNDILGFFTPELSKGGVTFGIHKKKRGKKIEDLYSSQRILTPHAAPLFFTDDKHRRPTMESIRNDKSLSKNPEPPQRGPGRNGKISQPSNLNQYLIKNINMIDQNKRIDTVEALLANAEEAQKNPIYIGQAYKYTQPERILDYDSEVHEEQKLISSNKKCDKCGLKVCQCHKEII